MKNNETKTEGQLEMEKRKNKANEILELLSGLSYSEAKGILETAIDSLKNYSIIQKKN